MTTPLFLLRCVQLGISIRDLDLLSIGMVNDMYVESSNDEYKYARVAGQAEFDKFWQETQQFTKGSFFHHIQKLNLISVWILKIQVYMKQIFNNCIFSLYHKWLEEAICLQQMILESNLYHTTPHTTKITTIITYWLLYICGQKSQMTIFPMTG